MRLLLIDDGRHYSIGLSPHIGFGRARVQLELSTNQTTSGPRLAPQESDERKDMIAKDMMQLLAMMMMMKSSGQECKVGANDRLGESRSLFVFLPLPPPHRSRSRQSSICLLGAGATGWSDSCAPGSEEAVFSITSPARTGAATRTIEPPKPQAPPLLVVSKSSEANKAVASA